MKISMIGQKGFPAISGGIEKHVQELSKQLVSRNHEVTVFCRGWYSDQIKIDSQVNRVFVPTLHTKHLDAIIHTFLSIVVAAWNKTEVFHIHGVGPALLAWLPKLLRPSAKVVVTFHCIDRRQQKWGRFARFMLWLGERAACVFPDKTITVSKTLTEYVKKMYNTETTYIPNGVNIPKTENKIELLKQFGLESDKYFIMVARLVEHKGQKTLIEGWKTAKTLRPELFGQMKLAIVGGGSFTDSYVEELKTLTADDNSIVLTGEQTGETLHTLFSNAHSAIHPSLMEGLPIAVLEAMSYSKCVLASDIPEHMEIVCDHGLSFRRSDTKHLAEHLIMMAESPELTKLVGCNAAEFVRANHTWDEIATQTDVLYRKLVSQNHENPVLSWLTRRKPLL